MARQQFKSELTFIPLLEECLRAFISVNSSLFESKTFHSPIWLGTPFDVALVVVDVEIHIKEQCLSHLLFGTEDVVQH